MNSEDLIQAHRIYASWQKTGPEDDVLNAYRIVFLSIDPAASIIELQNRSATLDEIWGRQNAKIKEIAASPVFSSIDSQGLREFVSIVSEAAFTISLRAILTHMVERAIAIKER